LKCEGLPRAAPFSSSFRCSPCLFLCSIRSLPSCTRHFAFFAQLSHISLLFSLTNTKISSIPFGTSSLLVTFFPSSGTSEILVPTGPLFCPYPVMTLWILVSDPGGRCVWEAAILIHIWLGTNLRRGCFVFKTVHLVPAQTVFSWSPLLQWEPSFSQHFRFPLSCPLPRLPLFTLMAPPRRTPFLFFPQDYFPPYFIKGPSFILLETFLFPLRCLFFFFFFERIMFLIFPIFSFFFFVRIPFPP